MTAEIQPIVVSCNSAEALPTCLRSLPTPLRLRTLVVDNGSTDASVAVVRDHAVRVVETGTNLGYARAANLGARAADGEVLCFLNPDCSPPAALFAEASSALSSTAGACAVPFLDEGEGLLPGRQPGTTRTGLAADALETAWGRAAPAGWLRRVASRREPSWWWPHGACLLIRRDVFHRLGGFDERFFLYMEDVDLGRRLYAAGDQVLQLDAVVPHRRSSGADVDSRDRRERLLEARLLYARLSYGAPFAALLRILCRPARRLWPTRSDPGRPGPATPAERRP